MARKQSEHLEQLRQVPLFAGVSARDLKRIGASVKEVHFPAGRVIFEQGHTGVGLHVVIEGETKVQVDGKTKRHLGPGAFFGEVALLDRGPRTATVIAETDITALSLPVWAFRSVLKENPSIAMKMLEELGRRLRSSEKSLSH